jgi:hypothetical protein
MAASNIGTSKTTVSYNLLKFQKQEIDVFQNQVRKFCPSAFYGAAVSAPLIRMCTAYSAAVRPPLLPLCMTTQRRIYPSSLHPTHGT